eukprot:TRINITY_DN1774_c0_g1_i1.p1 TRINITY_DN1774_c0_g1~~TRINITY_DN1774_c0_g1_i1.p1  ORF type:complete len:1700 (+),score=411.86 TRINITY_DN1774_c0_g1_i1:52-5151(+)
MAKGGSTRGGTPRRRARAPFDPTGASGSALVLHQSALRPSEPQTRGASPIRHRSGERHNPGYALVPASIEPFPSAYTRATQGKSQIIWELETSEGWRTFPEEECHRLETCYAGGTQNAELLGKGGRMYTYSFTDMTQTTPSGDVRKIKRSETVSGYQIRPPGFTDYSVQFVRRHNPKFNIQLEGFFGGTCEKGTVTGCEAVCSEVVSTGHVWTGEKDGTVKIWNAKTGQRLRTQDQKKDIYCSSLLEVPGPDGSATVWAGYTDSVIRVLNSQHPYEVRLNLRRHAPGARINVLVPQVGGHCVFSGGGDGQIFQWDIRTYECVNQFSGHRNSVRALIADADVLYSASDDGTIAVWDIYGRDRVEWRGHSAGVHHLVKTDRHIWSGSEDETVRIWNMETGECLSVLRDPHSGAINAMELVGDKVWTSSGGTLFLWSARDIGQPPIAQYSNSHSGYVTNIPVIHKSVLVRVWTTGKEGQIKIWNAECSADYDAEEVLRPQLDKKKQEVCYLKERLIDLENEYRDHSQQQDARIEKLKEELEASQAERAEKMAALANTKSELAQEKQKRAMLEDNMKRHDDKIDELARDLSIEKSKAAGIQHAHQKELIQVRKDGAIREEEHIRKIARLESSLAEGNRELAKMEELQKTLDMMDIKSGLHGARGGSVTSRVHALIEENARQQSKLADLQKELDRKDADLIRLRSQARKAADDAEDANKQLLVQKTKEAARQEREKVGRSTSSGEFTKRTPPASSLSHQGDSGTQEQPVALESDHLAHFDEGDQYIAPSLSPGRTAIEDTASIGYTNDEESRKQAAQNDNLTKQLAAARSKAAVLEAQLEAERQKSERLAGDLEYQKEKLKGASLTKLVQGTPPEERLDPHSGGPGAFGTNRSAFGTGGDQGRRASVMSDGPRPQEADNPADWVYKGAEEGWVHDPEAHADDLPAEELRSENGDVITTAAGQITVRQDGLLIGPDGRPVQGTDGSWVVQGDDGQFDDGSGNIIDINVAPNGNLQAYTVRKETNAQDEGNPVALGTPDGVPCQLHEDGTLSWQGKSITGPGNSSITWESGRRPVDNAGRQVVGVTEYGKAIVLNAHNDPVVLPVGQDGGVLTSADGRHVIEPLGGRPQLEDGSPVVCGGDSRPVATTRGVVAYSAPNGTIVGPDGKEVVGPSRSKVSLDNHGTPVDKDGPLSIVVQPNQESMEGVLPPGTPVAGHDGKVIVGPTSSTPVTIGTDGKSVVGPDGRMAMGPDGHPVVVSNKGRPQTQEGVPVTITVDENGRAIVEGSELRASTGGIAQERQREFEKQTGFSGNNKNYSSGRHDIPSSDGRALEKAQAQHSIALDSYRQQLNETNARLEDAQAQLDRALADLDVERELSQSLRDKVDMLCQGFGEGTTDQQVAALQKELAQLTRDTTRKEEDLVRRIGDHKDQLEIELGRKLSLIEQERAEEVQKFRDMVDRRDESLRLFNEKQRGMLSHIKQLEDNIHQANTEQAMIFDKAKNPAQLPTNELIYYYKYKEEQYAKIGGLNQQLHEENGALMGQTQALTEKLHAVSFVIESRPSLLKVLYDLYKMCVHARKTIDKFSKEVGSRERTRRELLDYIGGIRTEVVDVMNGEKWLIANMFTEYELLHLGTSPSFFVPDGKRFSKYKPSTFSRATGTGRWTRTSVHNNYQGPATPRGMESPRTTSPMEYAAGRPASPQRDHYY